MTAGVSKTLRILLRCSISDINLPACRKFLIPKSKQETPPQGSRNSLDYRKGILTVRTHITTSKKRRKRRRICNNCEEILGTFTMVCPRCDGYTLTWTHIAVIAVLAALVFLL